MLGGALYRAGGVPSPLIPPGLSFLRGGYGPPPAYPLPPGARIPSPAQGAVEPRRVYAGGNQPGYDLQAANAMRRPMEVGPPGSDLNQPHPQPMPPPMQATNMAPQGGLLGAMLNAPMENRQPFPQPPPAAPGAPLGAGVGGMGRRPSLGLLGALR